MTRLSLHSGLCYTTNIRNIPVLFLYLGIETHKHRNYITVTTEYNSTDNNTNVAGHNIL